MRYLLLLLLACSLAGCKPVVRLSADGELAEPDGKCTVTVSRDDAVNGSVTVNLSYAGANGRYEGAQRSVSVPEGGHASFTLTVLDDQIDQPDTTLTISIEPGQYNVSPSEWQVPVPVIDDDVPTPPDPAFDELADKVKSWKADLSPAVAAKASDIGQVYLDVAGKLDAMEIGSIGQAGELIGERISNLLEGTDRTSWDAMAAQIGAIYLKYNVSHDRKDVITFFRIVGKALQEGE